MLFFNSNACDAGDRIRLESPVINTSGKTGINVSFAWYESEYGHTDSLTIQYSTDKVHWTNVSTFMRYNPDGGWKTKSVMLPVGAENQDYVYVGFLFTSAWGFNCYLDDVNIRSIFPQMSLSAFEISQHSITMDFFSVYLYEVSLCSSVVQYLIF